MQKSDVCESCSTIFSCNTTSITTKYYPVIFYILPDIEDMHLLELLLETKEIFAIAFVSPERNISISEEETRSIV